ncbi:TM2 domain-containing protein [Prevotella ihumii]|uniref:TM2 domain-containing protein n=1 Tax=Prevotella ihumii TaxID=1917878 RepID=UPI000980A4EA|nr:TM2 domain-containing protein [Prevotella ihumii]
MDENKIDQLLMIYGAKLPFESIEMVRDYLRTTDPSNINLKFTMMKDPTLSIILSVLLGQIGVDRIYIGDTLYGILKLITCGGFGIWWIVDLFLIMDATKQKNLEVLLGTNMY